MGNTAPQTLAGAVAQGPLKNTPVPAQKPTAQQTLAPIHQSPRHSGK